MEQVETSTTGCVAASFPSAQQIGERVQPKQNNALGVPFPRILNNAIHHPEERAANYHQYPRRETWGDGRALSHSETALAEQGVNSENDDSSILHAIPNPTSRYIKSYLSYDSPTQQPPKNPNPQIIEDVNSLPKTFTASIVPQTTAPSHTPHKPSLNTVSLSKNTLYRRSTYSDTSAYAAIGVCVAIGIIAGFILYWLYKKRQLRIGKVIVGDSGDYKPSRAKILNPGWRAQSITLPKRNQLSDIVPSFWKSSNRKTNNYRPHHTLPTSKSFIQTKESTSNFVVRFKRFDGNGNSHDPERTRSVTLPTFITRSTERVASLISSPRIPTLPSLHRATSAFAIGAEAKATPDRDDRLSMEENRNIPCYTPSTFKIYGVEMNFSPVQDGQVKLEAGQSVKIYQFYDHGWVYCVNRETGQDGLAPRACLSIWPTTRTESDVTMFPGHRNFSVTSFGSSHPISPSSRFYNQFSPS
ncbi:hypothetical protein ETB97_005315 [Aspergillus alliaceus]|uniref:SH3 domain-containing protein n=1 Tax=Petromyces alliaceus TaxID=209559 RepID=A0A5N7CMR7_PETAA|nr:hypothetical protein BDV23DRAFT_178572 [Aspergillus alliaceus]KAF5865074.1 hypothetical protein ETB97_005315 [Aspergillus burnettii]